MGAYGWELGSLDLTTVAEDVRIEDEAGSYFPEQGFIIPGREGVVYDDETPRAPMVIPLRVILKAQSQSANLSKIKAQLNKRGLVTLKRTLTYPEDKIRALVKNIAKPIHGPDRTIYTFLLSAPSGSWQDDAESSDTGSPAAGVETSGDTEIFDPRVSLPSAGTRTVTTAEGLVYSIVAASGPTYPIVIDVGAGTILDNGGNDASGAVTFSHQHWFRLSADHTHTITGSGTWFWRNRWA